MKIIDQSEAIKKIPYGELELYETYRYINNYDGVVSGLYLSVDEGLVDLESQTIVMGRSASSWPGEFVNVKCEIYIVN